MTQHQMRNIGEDKAIDAPRTYMIEFESAGYIGLRSTRPFYATSEAHAIKQFQTALPYETVRYIIAY